MIKSLIMGERQSHSAFVVGSHPHYSLRRSRILSMSAPIPPPFLFPEMWRAVYCMQRWTGERHWLVPDYREIIAAEEAEAAQTQTQTSNPAEENGTFHEIDITGEFMASRGGHAVDGAAQETQGAQGVWEGQEAWEGQEGQEGQEGGEGGEGGMGVMEEVLVFSEEWAARLSKTIRRMKQKAHKSRVKAAFGRKR
jgi:hypothetical protein